MFNFEDRIDLIFKTGFFNFQFNFSRALALAEMTAAAAPAANPGYAGNARAPWRAARPRISPARSRGCAGVCLAAHCVGAPSLASPKDRQETRVPYGGLSSGRHSGSAR